MNILLVQPVTISSLLYMDKIFMHEPVALEYVGAALKDEHNVEIMDMRIESDLKSKLEQFKPQVVGFTGYTINVNTIIELSKLVKELNPTAKVVIGGHHATVCPHDFYVPTIDGIFIGEGVCTFKEYVKALQDNTDIALVDGMAFNNNGQFVRNKDREYPQLDEFRFPDRSLTEKYRDKYFMEDFKPLATMRTSRGCVFKCKFCTLWKLAGGKYYVRDPKCTVEELKQIKEPYVFFADDESFIDFRYMDALADEIMKAGIKKKYYAYVRSDTVIHNTDLIRKWASIGLAKVHMGIESHREADLVNWNKRNSVENNVRAIRLAEEMGIEVTATFIINQDYDSDDFDGLRKFVANSNIKSSFFSVLTPLPGTDLYKEVEEQLILKNYDYFDMIHTVLPTKLSIRRFYTEYANLYIQSNKHNFKNKDASDYTKPIMIEMFTNLRKIGRDYKTVEG